MSTETAVVIDGTAYAAEVPLGFLRGRIARRMASAIADGLQAVTLDVSKWKREYGTTHVAVITRDTAAETIAATEDVLGEEGLDPEVRERAESIRDTAQRRLDQMNASEKDYVEVPELPTDQETQLYFINTCFDHFEDEAIAFVALFVIPKERLLEGWRSSRSNRDDKFKEVLDSFADEVFTQATMKDFVSIGMLGIEAYRNEVVEIVGDVGKLLARIGEEPPNVEPTTATATSIEVSTPSSPTLSTPSPAPTDGVPSESSPESDTTSSGDSPVESTMSATAS